MLVELLRVFTCTTFKLYIYYGERCNDDRNMQLMAWAGSQPDHTTSSVVLIVHICLNTKLKWCRNKRVMFIMVFFRVSRREHGDPQIEELNIGEAAEPDGRGTGNLTKANVNFCCYMHSEHEGTRCYQP